LFTETPAGLTSYPNLNSSTESLDVNAGDGEYDEQPVPDEFKEDLIPMHSIFMMNTVNEVSEVLDTDPH